jgi:hypothetical protein
MAEIVTEPGYITEFTDRGAKGRYTGGKNVRFRNGLPQKIGGASHLASNTFLGVIRRMKDWVALDDNKYIAAPSNERFYVFDGGNFINVTPIRESGTLGTDPITTASGLTTVSIADVAHGLAVGDHITLGGATAVGGITVDGDYTVTSVTSADIYVITHSAAASSTANGGGAGVTYSYEISIGRVSAEVGYGWGASTWGASTWGTARPASSIALPLRTVSLDEWGEDIIWNIRRGAIYVFNTSGGVSSGNPATLITQAPDTARFIIVSQVARHLIAFGAHDGSSDDPMLIAWCDQEDYTVWTPSATNTAGDIRIDAGTEIVTAVYTKAQILVLTDTTAYSLVYIGYPEVFSINPVGYGCGAISPNCAISHGNSVYWMAEGEFWEYNGGTTIIPCEIKNYVFDNLNRLQKDKVSASIVSEFNEVWWMCPHNDGGYFIVAFNYVGRFFWFTTCDDWATPRSAMIDKGEYSSKPIAAGHDGYLWTCETGVDQESTTIPTELVRFYDELGNDNATIVTELIPDFREIVGSVNVTLNGRRFPAPDTDTDPTPDTTKGAYAFTPTTRKKNLKIRAKYISIVISSDAPGADWKGGTLQVTAGQMGRKG